MGLAKKRLELFERYLTVGVPVHGVVGVVFGKELPGVIAALSEVEFGQGSEVMVP